MTPSQSTPAGERARLDELAAYIAALPHFAALGLTVRSLEPGHCDLGLPYRAELAGDPDTGVLHGGVVTTLIDSAAGMAVFAMLEGSRAVATLDMRIDYLRPAETGKTLLARAKVYRMTRNVAFVRATAHQGAPDHPVAHCAASFMLGAVGFTPDRRMAAGEAT